MGHAQRSEKIRKSLFRKWSIGFFSFLLTSLLATTVFAGSISGIVSNSGGGGIEGIDIFAFDAATNNQIQLVSSGPDGSYTISGLRAGSYKLQFYGWLPGYTYQFYNGKSSLALADAVSVTEGNDTTGINATLSLAKFGTISGTVRNTAGDGIYGISVSAYDASSDVFVKTVTSQSGGSYTIADLPAGNYKLQFSDNYNLGYISQWYNNQPSQAQADPVSVTAGIITPVITAVLSNTSAVSLSVTIEGSGSVNRDPAGTPCTDGVCTAMYDSGVEVRLMATTANGNSTFAGWTGACTNSIGDCILIMDSAKDVTATFTANPATVKIDGDIIPYYSIGSALDAISTVGNTVRARSDIFIENVIMTSPVSILFMGGYTDSGFSTRTPTSTTVIDGSLRIRKGTLRVERLVVR